MTDFCTGLIESQGYGIERIIKACEDNGNPAPEWQVSGGDFWAIFHFSYPNDMADLKSETGVTDQVADQVTSEVSRLLAVIRGEMTRGELQIVWA